MVEGRANSERAPGHGRFGGRAGRNRSGHGAAMLAPGFREDLSGVGHFAPFAVVELAAGAHRGDGLV